jgi:hypothetical protein
MGHLNEDGYFSGLLAEWFSFESNSLLPSLVVLGVPLLLFFVQRSDPKYRQLAIIYCAVLLVFLAMGIVMRRLPFYRNLIAHGHLALLCAMIALDALGTQLKPRISRLLLGGLLVAWIIGAVGVNARKMHERLYYYNINALYAEHKKCAPSLEDNSRIFIDDACFYWFYFLLQRAPQSNLRLALNKRAFQQQDYCIVPPNTLPPGDSTMYVRVGECAESVIFRLKKYKGQKRE